MSLLIYAAEKFHSLICLVLGYSPQEEEQQQQLLKKRTVSSFVQLVVVFASRVTTIQRTNTKETFI